MSLLGKTKIFAPILSAVVVTVCVGTSVSSYTPNVYEVQAMPVVEESDEEAYLEAAEDAADETQTETVIIAEGEFDLEDGVYYGTGTGFGGEITVAVTIKDHTIVSIEIISADNEDEAFLNRALAVIDSIINAQSTDVDTVSGATYSSRGIINAVINALSGEVIETETASSEAAAAGSTTVEAVEDAAAYADGTYYGSGTGFRGTITVKVVISGGVIKSISVVSSSDDAAYFNRAVNLLSTIVSTQSTNVDTVSGATYSSVGLINAVRNALSKASISESAEEEEELVVAVVESTSFETPVVEEGTSGSYPYPDGTYYGTAEGYNDDITVAVVLEDGSIVSVEIVSADDDDPYFSNACALTTSIVTAQSADIDIVSGATYSSKGILNAVKAALEAAKAAAEGTTAETVTTNTSSSTSGNKTSSSTNTKKDTQDTDKAGDVQEGYADGTYTVSVVCSPDSKEQFEAYNLTVTVVIENGKIVEIKDIAGDGDEDNDRYIGYAVNGRTTSSAEYISVVTQILENQSTNDVDVVTKATCTSNSIIEAVNLALEQALAAGSSATDDSDDSDDEDSADSETSDDTSDESGKTTDTSSSDNTDSDDSADSENPTEDDDSLGDDEEELENSGSTDDDGDTDELLIGDAKKEDS